LSKSPPLDHFPRINGFSQDQILFQDKTSLGQLSHKVKVGGVMKHIGDRTHHHSLAVELGYQYFGHDGNTGLYPVQDGLQEVAGVLRQTAV